MNTQEAVHPEEQQAVEFVVRAKELELILRRAPVEPDNEPLALPESETEHRNRDRSWLDKVVRKAVANDETIVF